MPASYRISFFNEHICQAQLELQRRNSFRTDFVRQSCERGALAHLTHALRLANQMQDGARKALCLRVLNWLRADLRRAA